MAGVEDTEEEARGRNSRHLFTEVRQEVDFQERVKFLKRVQELESPFGPGA